MRLIRHILILVAVAGLAGLSSVQPVWAELAGNYYINPLHHVSFGRPNEAWKFLEIPPPQTGSLMQGRALAVFTDGDGEAIAMLAHCPIDPVNALRGAGDMNDRWPSMVGEIIALVSTGETSPWVEDSAYETTAQAVTFDIRYRSVSPGDGEFLENWVTGFLVRDTADQQHIYAIRCAAPQAGYKAWESDFARIMPTLRFEGPRRAPVFIPQSTLKYWLFWGGLGAVLGVVFIVIRSHRRKTEFRESVRAMQHMESTAKAQADLQNIPDQVASSMELSNVPDQFTWPAELPPVAEHTAAHASVRNQAPYLPPDTGHTPDTSSPAEPAVAVQSELANGFWKCVCGRINPASYEFCARCNADHGKK